MKKLDIVSTFDLEYLIEKYSTYIWKQEYVSLELITFKKWSDSKYEQNKALIMQTNGTIPIVLQYDEENKKYWLQDGNHRCYCAKELGYTHICAIILQGINIDSSDDSSQ